jgi:hypothetical protein
MTDRRGPIAAHLQALRGNGIIDGRRLDVCQSVHPPTEYGVKRDERNERTLRSVGPEANHRNEKPESY